MLSLLMLIPSLPKQCTCISLFVPTRNIWYKNIFIEELGRKVDEGRVLDGPDVLEVSGIFLLTNYQVTRI